jgi:HD-GYP domain-containing protein (c-di-GMP phosphodiesterase class II)
MAPIIAEAVEQPAGRESRRGGLMDIDSYSSAEGETLLRSARERLTNRNLASRVVITELIAAAACVGLALAIALLGSSPTHLSLSRLAITMAVFLVTMRVRFPVAAGWTRPTQLVFVPMLFLLPTQLVPLIVIGCLLLDLWPEVLGQRVSTMLVLARIADGAYAIGPAFVLVLFGDQRFSWTDWPVYVLAFGSQVVLDAGAGMLRTWSAERIPPRTQLPMLWLYGVDLSLACASLLVTASAVTRPGLLLLALPVVWLLGLFARERERRLDSALELSSAYRGTAILLSDVIEADHEYTGIHSREVVDLSLAVSDRLGLGPSARLNVEFGALLHDVGKIRVPSEIIDKPRNLDEDEWAVIRRHTIYGQEMLEKVGGTLAGVGQVVRSSHEHFNGRGYPDGLAGTAIPIEARIVAACDAYNAMTTTRSYSAAMTPAEAREELIRCSGTQFDPDVVAAIVRELGLV